MGLQSADARRHPGVSASWRHLRPEHRRWILVNAVVVGAATSVIVSAVLAWASAAGQPRVPQIAVPLLEGPSVLTDTLGTFFLLPLLTTVFCTTAIRSYQRRGLLPALASGPDAPSLLDHLPFGTMQRGLALGAISTAILSAPAVCLILTLDPHGMTTYHFVIYKAVLGLALGAVITPAVAVYAMAREAQPR